MTDARDSDAPPGRDGATSGLGDAMRQKLRAARASLQLSAPLDLLAPGALVGGRYEVVRLIGRGGCCDVLQAIDRGSGDLPCAIKVPRPERVGSRSLDARLRLEASATAMLRSPHTAAALDFGVLPDGRSYFVMEFLRGLSLSALLARDRRVAALHVANIAMDVLHALIEAHSLGIVHRDIKPSNVMLAHDPRVRRPYARLVDFGIAKLTDDVGLALTAHGAIPCTPLYAAPEHLRGEPEARSDLYSLGLLMTTLLDGQAPYWGMSPAEVADAQCSPDPVPLGAITRQSALHPVVEIAAAKPREQRFDSAGAMREALRGIRDELVRAPDAPMGLHIDDADLDFEGAGTTESIAVERL